MANDFRANQVRLNKIISSGSIPILIYPSSSAADFQGGLTNFSTTAVGTDVFLYVSGAVGARGGGSPKISVFGGDLHVSGNFTVDGTAPGGPSFFTEIGFEQIETTGSVAMTYLSSSTGAEITGSLTNGFAGLVVGSFAHAEGANTTASGYGSHSEGFNTLASNFYSHAEGTATIASGFYSHAEGNTTVASAMSSHAEGEFTTASGQSSHAEGAGTTAGPNPYAHAQGLNTLASGYASHAEGFFTTSSINYSHAEGSGSVASGIASHAEGENTVAAFIYSHAEGSNTSANNIASHAEGAYTVTNGEYSHAEGSGTTTYGNYSHTEGFSATTYGDYSHAEGQFTVTYGTGSHAEGFFTIAHGESSHTEGYGSEAVGTGSFAAGLYTVASGAVDGASPPTTIQAAFGKYNLQNNNDSLFVVGDGFDGSNRHDVLRVNSGSVQITGSLIAPTVTGSIQYVDDANSVPFLTASTNITVSYNTSGQWEITGSNPPSFFTEIALDSIATTGSVAMTYLSASTGAEITGSFKISGSSVVFDYNGLFPNEITLQNTNTGDELYLTTSSLGYINGITPDKFLITSDGVLEISSNVSRISLNSNSEITGSLDVLGEINVYSGSIVPGFVIQPNTDGTGSIDILYDKDLSGISIINMRPLYVTMSTDSNSGILLSGSLLTSKLTTSTIGKIDFNILAIAPTTDDYASWLFSTTVVQDSTNTVKLLVASELDSIFSGSNATTWDVNINSNGDVYCTGSNAATVHWYAQVTKKMVLSGSSVIVY